MPMSREDKSFWSGAMHGLWDGAFRGFIIGGLIAVGLVIAAGAIGTMIAGGTLAHMGVTIATGLYAFMAGGTIGAVAGAVIDSLYEGVNEYIEEKEIQRDCKRAHELGFIEKYKVREKPKDDNNTKVREEPPTALPDTPVFHPDHHEGTPPPSQKSFTEKHPKKEIVHRHTSAPAESATTRKVIHTEEYKNSTPPPAAPPLTPAEQRLKDLASSPNSGSVLEKMRQRRQMQTENAYALRP